jgi:diguanylate cyclase (GGDEF)-like protein
VNDNAVETVAIPGDAHNRLALVPMTDDGKVARVYAFVVDQTAAAALTNVALTVVTLTTSLLIVLGFSVPAAIASRRIRERWLAEDQIRYLAMHSLTGSPNRLQLHQHLDRAVARGKRYGHLMAVFGLDLDRFKDVNDTLGHATGDALLAEVAARLKESTREVDLVGRLGGDEFAIVAGDLDAPEDAMRLARRIWTALGEPYHVNGHEVTSSASIGIAIGPLDREPPDTLLKHADLALYRAKEDGRNTYRFFEPAMDAALQKRRRLENDLRNALRKNQLYLDYQPQFDLENGKLTGYEALVRWRWWHPSEGEIPPTTFLPIAEETGLIVPLGEWILRTACAYATTWPLDLSPAQFKTQDVLGLVRRVLNETGLEAHRLELEITEGILLQNTESVMETLTRLDQLGVSIAMDDFGTGYSSLSYLTRFPVKKIKIDRSFIDTLGTSPQTSAIVSSIVGLGQSLKVTITAEGVETEGQAAMLKKWAATRCRASTTASPQPKYRTLRRPHAIVLLLLKSARGARLRGLPLSRSSPRSAPGACPISSARRRSRLCSCSYSAGRRSSTPRATRATCSPKAGVKSEASTIRSWPQRTSPWIASLFFLISPQAPIVWPLIAYYLALQIVRYWVIASLGRFWTHRIIMLADAPIARSGPYRYLSHPNYTVTIVETLPSS